MKNIGVVGSGQMGWGIAYIAAHFGYKIILYDVKKKAAEQAYAKITSSLKKANLQVAKTLADFKNCFLIIEAVKEDYAVKEKLFEQLSVVDDNTILATNTSSLSINQLSKNVTKPERFVGLHFMNPPKVMPLVELIPCVHTSQLTIDKAREFCKSLEKQIVICKDQPGFIVNRLLLPMINQAIIALEQGLAAKEDIDKAMKLGANFPMGPLALADFIGLDTCLFILENFYKEDPELTKPPAKLLENMIKEGKLGKKTGEGFYNY